MEVGVIPMADRLPKAPAASVAASESAGLDELRLLGR